MSCSSFDLFDPFDGILSWIDRNEIFSIHSLKYFVLPNVCLSILNYMQKKIIIQIDFNEFNNKFVKFKSSTGNSYFFVRVKSSFTCTIRIYWKYRIH